MRVEILNTGTELLLGSVLNTHVRLFAEALFPMGLRIQRQVAVPDGNPIREAIAETPGRAEIVLITGGLGPTTDDITRDAVSEWLGLELTRDASVAAAIGDRFARRGLTMTPRNLRQADRPAAARVLPNPNGTAPGLYLPPQPVPDSAGMLSPQLFLLPGPPRELKPMLWDHVLPILRGIVPIRADNQNLRLLRLVGVGESTVEHAVGEALLALGLELGYCARPNEVDVRMIGTIQQLERGESIVRAAFET
ncbi:MAG: molybdopterin-binding protein, partial [Chthoniobacteraceae bacterium]